MIRSIAARRRITLAILLGPITVILGVFFLAPLAIMALYSLLEPGLYGGVDWNFYHWNYGRVLGWADGIMEEFDSIYAVIFFRSFKLALTTVVLTLVICYPVAFWVSRLPGRTKTLCLFLITLPFFASLIVRLYAWVMILKPSGALQQILSAVGLDIPVEIIFTERAVITGMVYVMIPFMFLPVYASVEKLNRSLIEASYDLGATRFQTFIRIMLPMTLPGIVGGSIIVFIPSLGNFVIPEVLGGAKVLMIGNLIEQQFLYARNWPFGAALAMMVMATVLILLFAYVTLVLRRSERDQGMTV
jgi:spermidine/putrescine transport system permease protein